MGTTNSSNLSSVTAPQYFTGISSFSSDFQSIIQRAVQIANLPVINLQSQEATINSKNQALQALEPGVSALGADIAALGMLAGKLGISASSSDSSMVSVVNTGATAPATYTVSNITSLASPASETSLQGYTATQAVSAQGHVNLVVGSQTYQLDLTGAGKNNLAGLAAAINSANAGVSANILTMGSTQYLAISTNRTGATTLQLNDVAPTDLITNTASGTETSLQSYWDSAITPVSDTGQVQLVVGGNTYSLDVSGSNNNLAGLVQAINNAGAGVTASITGNPGEYYLSISTNAHTQASIQLISNQNPTNLVSSSNQGSNASFSLNGIPINESTNNITDVIPGVSFTLLEKPASSSTSVTLSLATDATQLSAALQTLVNDYNALVGQVQAQQGQGAGPLQGDLIIHQISGDMQGLVTYWNPASTSTIRSLSDLGITFNTTGKMSFDASTFQGLSDNQVADAFKFIGSATSGFAQLASNFTQLSDPLSGLIQAQIDGYETTITDLNNQIATAQQHVTQVQRNATAQATAADALVAQLQSQQTAVNASLQSLNYVLYGRQVGANGM